ncbi:MAG: enoyl-CoA hydratase [Acidobacteria bacterium]|nr:MAG: enoyl-CoA hydratase [Acidobacteriota bacterium]
MLEGVAKVEATVAPSGAVRVERRERVARLVINRPPLNVLNIETIRELGSRFEAVSQEPGIELIELRSALPAAFSSGTDVREHFSGSARQLLTEFHALIRKVLDSARPTLALVEGYCLGGGMELAIACDFIIATREAKFGQPEIRLGAFPPIAAVLLPRLIPEKPALEMILTGKTVTGEEAWRLGFVNRVASAAGPDGDTLEEQAAKFRKEILAQSPAVTAIARRVSRLGSRETFEAALREAERVYLEELLPTEDAEEGLRAFLAKRPPKWKGK